MLKRNQKGIIDPLFMVAVVLVLVVGGLIYWRTSSDSNNENSDTNNNQTSQTTETESENDDEAVLAAAEKYCHVQITETTGKPRVLFVGTQGPNGIKIAYSDDNNFASLNVNCHDEGVEPEGGVAYILKKADEQWAVIASGNDDFSTREDIPEFNY